VQKHITLTDLQQQVQPAPQQKSPQQSGYPKRIGLQQSQNEDSSMHNYDKSSQRPGSRGSNHSVQSSGSAYSGQNQHYHNQQADPYGTQLQTDDDDDDDMW